VIALTIDNLPVVPARRTDPATSHAPRKAVTVRAGSQRAVLLAAYANAGAYGLTNDGAGVVSGLADRPGCCYWKRCGELLAGGFIAATHHTRTSRAGEAQRVCVITARGWATLDNMGGKA
jgi:hypothetical protein